MLQSTMFEDRYRENSCKSKGRDQTVPSKQIANQLEHISNARAKTFALETSMKIL